MFVTAPVASTPPRKTWRSIPTTPERIVAIEHEMASLDWLGFDVLDAPVVTASASTPRRTSR
jgi:hypothetical protein